MNKQDEIDLIELVKILWNKKLWIFLSTFICVAIAGIYAFTAKEQWTSKAEVIAPKLRDLGDYFVIRKEYARILKQDFDYGALSSGLYNKFNLYTESLDKREEFFLQSEIYKDMVYGKSELAKKQILSNLINKSIYVIKPDAKKEPNLIGRRINFSADTAQLAQKTLLDFLTFNSFIAYQEEVDNFLIGFNEILKDLRKEKFNFERDLRIQKSVQLANLNKALNIAKEAGIRDHLKPFDMDDEAQVKKGTVLGDTKVPISDSKLSDGTYLFMLGETFLKAQIDVVTNLEIIYPPRYYLVTELLNELEPLLEKAKKVKAQSFSYQASPDYPVVKDKPKKAIILTIGLLLGLILSSLIVLMLNFINRK